MTLAITGRNPNDVFPITLRALRDRGVYMPSRNGPCLEYPEPVSVTFLEPRERVLFHPKRAINPFLHFFEPFWLLAGRRDVAFLSNIVKKFEAYSDDGKTFAAAYGHRLRSPVDQVAQAIERLRVNPDDRQVVLQIRTPEEILYRGKDTACNMTVALKIRDRGLRAHVFNRSNDSVWGGPAGGTNHPQFTVLQEYIAGHVGCGLGTYTVTTDSMHVYTNDQWDALKDEPAPGDPYLSQHLPPMPLMMEPKLFEGDLRATFSEEDAWKTTGERKYASLYFSKVYQPMWMAFTAFKAKDVGAARGFAARVASPDWALVTDQWLMKHDKQALQ